jgi:hypothetical protein
MVSGNRTLKGSQMKFIHRIISYVTNRDQIALLESRIKKLEVRVAELEFNALPPFMGIQLQAMPIDELLKAIKDRQDVLRV